jgi:pyridoxal phosphate enzyme (YggS family)
MVPEKEHGREPEQFLSILDHLNEIRTRIEHAARRAGRDPASVAIVAVTKTVDVRRIEEVLSSGVRILGENRVQEAGTKISRIGRGPEWHLIGHLQTNKVRQAVALFDTIHSVDSLRLAEALDREAGKQNRELPILIQVKLSGEESKYGLAPDALPELVRSVAAMKNLKFEGLMTIPPYADDPEKARPIYRRLCEMAEEIESWALPGVRTTRLSMGMSHDFETAVEEGATWVRIGSAIFGERAKN